MRPTRAPPFLDLLSDDDRARLLGAATIRRAGKGASLIAAEDPPGEMFVILEGRARVAAVSPEGREVSYRAIGPGDVVGELSLLDGLPRSASVTALTPVRAAALSPGAFERLAGTAPSIPLALARHLAAQMRAMTTRVLELSTMLMRERLVAELIRAAEPASGDAGVIREPPTHAELAARIGAEREAVTKELGKLARAGRLARRDGVIVIPSLDALGAALAQRR